MFMPEVGDGEGTPGAGLGPADPWALLADAMRMAKDALKNSKCSGLFGNKKTRTNGFDPTEVLDSIAAGGRFGSIRFSDDGDPGSTTANGGVPKMSASSVMITINAPNWLIGNTLYNAELLLHELGHAFDIIRGSGGSVIKSPDSLPSFIPIIGGDKRSSWNDWKIDQDCFNGAMGYKKP
jgi:hypothetical protein